MPRIYFLLPHAYGSGGVPRTVLTLAGQLARNGHQVEVISIHRKRPKPYFPVDRRVSLSYLEDRTPEAGGARARDNASSRRAASLLDQRPSQLEPSGGSEEPEFSALTDLRLWRRLRRLQPGYLIATRPQLAVAAARWAPGAVIKIVQEHISFQARNLELRSQIRSAAGRLDALITLTEADRDAWRGYLGDKAPVVDVVPNASPFPVGEPPDLDGKVVVAAGRLAEQKGFDRLIAAFGPVAREHPDWRLHIYGKGSLRSDLQAQIAAAQLERWVFLKGFSNRFQLVLARSAVFAMTSHYEGLPMVLLEAMSVGLPMVSFDCPEGPRQLILDGYNGLLIPDGDIAAFTAALRDLITSADRRRKLSAGALASATAYQLPVIAEQWERLFLLLAARRQAAALH